MIGEPMPNPRDAIIQDLNQKLEQFFGSGKTIQQIDSGVSAEAPFVGTTSHHNKLRAKRDKIAPQVRELAEAGKTASEIAVDLKMHLKRVQLIGHENGFRFAEPS
jgi:predicted polyphosphate/ATP-dependent NAD kinase